MDGPKTYTLTQAELDEIETTLHQAYANVDMAEIYRNTGNFDQARGKLSKAVSTLRKIQKDQNGGKER